MIDYFAVRKQSLNIVKRLGYPINERLPILDESVIARTEDNIVDRLIAMLCVAACAYGFDSQKASIWINRESKSDSLTLKERNFLLDKTGNKSSFMLQIEGMWALAWSINAIPSLDFGEPCSQDFVKRLPDLKCDGSASKFRDAARIRDLSEIVSACDTAYCLHWAIRDSQLRNIKRPGKVEEYVIVERRRALEWLLTDEPWEDISLDT